MSIEKYSSTTKLIESYRDSVVNMIYVSVPAVSGVQSDLFVDAELVDCTITGDIINAKLKTIIRGGNSANYSGRITDFGTRLKPYIDCYTGATVTPSADVYCQSNFLISTP